VAGTGAAWLDFDGVFRNSTVWLNGEMLGNHSSGYTSFRYGNVLPLLKTSPSSVNVLVVRADATHMEGWFYEGGGIYRDVWLTVAAAVHVKPWGVQVISLVDETAMDTATGVSKGGMDAAPVSVNVLTSVVNDGDTASVVRVVGEVFDVATNKSLGKSTSDPVTLPPAPTRSSSSSSSSSSPFSSSSFLSRQGPPSRRRHSTARGQ
jgi:beta-galactosidase